MMKIVNDKKRTTDLIPIAYFDKIIAVIADDGDLIYESTTAMQPVPYIDTKHNQRSMVFISGPSGSGKSTMARDLALNLRKRLNDAKRKIILFTKNSEPDPAFLNISNFIQIGMSTDPFFLEINSENLANTTCIFDDWETLHRTLLSHVTLLIKDLSERSRKLNVSLFVINHQTMNYSVTRGIIFESDSFVLFPGANQNSFRKFAKSYLDIGDTEISDMIKCCKQPHSFILIHKSVPRYYQTKNKIIMLQ